MAKIAGGHFTADFIESYVVGAAIAEAHQAVAIFLPDPTAFPIPAEGYPIVLALPAGGFVTNVYGTVVPFTDPAILAYRILNELGIAIGWMGSTGTFDDLAGTLNTTSNGRGIFHPPGTVGWDDDLRYSAQKEATLVVQLTKERAATWSINPNRIMLEGASSGATALQFPAFAPDQADASKDDHRRQSSRVRGIRMGIPQTDWKIYAADEPAPANFNFFPDAGGDITTDLSPDYESAPSSPVDYLRWASALRIGLDTARARTPNASGLYVWQHSYQGGKNLTDLGLVGTWGESEGKEPAELDQVDPSPPANRHESGHAILLARALREVESGLWHTQNSRLVLDQATYDYAIGIDPTLATLVNHIQPTGTTDPVLLSLELAWIASALLDPATSPELETLPPVDSGDVVDIGVSMGLYGADFDFEQGDLRRETGLRSAIIASLFSDARAPAELTPLPDGSTDPRGWWAEDVGERYGSLLWLFDREKLTDETTENVRQAAEESLGWLISEGIAEAVTVSANRIAGSTPRIELTIGIERRASSKWAQIWESIAGEAFDRGGLLVTLDV